MAEYTRPNGFRFNFLGLNLRSQPDGLPPGKYAVAQNIRALSDNSIIARPGYTQEATGLGSITDIKAYATLETDDNPRFLFRNTSNAIKLETGTTEVTLAGSAGEGVNMLPFRPSASPQTWMYVASLGDFQKLSAPDGSNNVIVQKVGIAEPLSAAVPAAIVQAVPLAPVYTDFTRTSPYWSASGTGGSFSDTNLFTDTIGAAVKADPLLSTRKSVSVDTPGYYIAGMEVEFNGGSTPIPIEQVLAAPPTTSIAAITYYSGTSGLCEIVLAADISGVLQRGSILYDSTQSEYFFVNWVMSGPNKTCTIEALTSATFAASDTISGLGAIIVNASPSAGQAVASVAVQSTITKGTATLTESLASNPLAGYSGDDYVYFSMLFQDITNLTSVTIAFANSAGSALLSYQITGPSLIPTLGELFQVQFQLSQMTGWSGSIPGSVAQVVFTFIYAGATSTVDLGSLWVGGGSSPDVGADGTVYQYKVVPRSSLTGAQGNPSADMRYGVSPRRQQVQLSLPSASYDSQIDTWDIYRYGGSITSYRYVDSVPSSNTTYIDDTFDDSLTGTQVLPTENFEPWPSVDVPFNPTPSTVTMVGTLITVTQASAGAWAATVASWLPGTLLIVDSGTFTLRSRPFLINSPTDTIYAFEVEENGGNPTLSIFNVPEPFVARSFNPYVWGPDAYGVFFGAGDLYRPGFLSYSTSYQPDEVPDTNNLELCSPSEPLLGGAIMQGLSYVASSKRWWGLYPTLTGTPAYQPVEIPVGHPLASPYGLCTNGQAIFYWGPDGIYMHQGGAAQSLTDADLYGLFPHDGIPGADVIRYGITVRAPDYSRAALFRLAVVKNYLYADYKDASGGAHTLVCDLRNNAWAVDVYHDPVTIHYAPEQQEGVLRSTGTLYPLCVMGTSSGLYLQQTDLSLDNATAIACQINTFEWDGGDLRATPQWGDLYLDGLFTYGATAYPDTAGAVVTLAATTITASGSRQYVVVPFLLGGATTKFVGMQVKWSENPTGSPTTRTTLYLWQPSVIGQPETTTTRYTDWYDLDGASYVRGFRLTGNTFNASKTLTIRNGDDNTSVTQAVTLNDTQEQAFAFDPPFIAHTVRIESDSTPWILFPGSVQWIKDKWPELTQEYSPWINPGNTTGAKYMLGCTIPMDTNGQAISFVFKSSDTGEAVILGPFTTAAGEKTEVPMAFIAPFICHNLQIQPTGPCRIWFDEINWNVVSYPELSMADTPVLPVSGFRAAYVRGILITADSADQPVFFVVEYDGQQIGPTIGPFVFNGKQTLSAAFSTPFIAHQYQLIPSAPVRVFADESVWDADPYPELIPEDTAILPVNGYRANYVRGLLLTADSANQPVSFTVKYDGGQIGPTVGPFSFNGKQTIPVAFSSPFIAHQYQLIPSAPVRIFAGDCQWDADVYPELITEDTAILPVGGSRARYVRGVIITADSADQPVSFSVRYDGAQIGPTIGPATFNGKNTIAFAFIPPFVAHQYQLVPNAPVRIFINECQWDADPYPELIPEYTPIMEISSADVQYVQGIILTADSANSPVSFTVNSDGGANAATIGPLTFYGKQTIPYVFSTPFIAHNWQLLPSAPVRIFIGESKWVTQPTPENMIQWGPTQWTAHGLTGYQSIYRVEISYNSTASVTFTITSYDGQSPTSIMLPSTGGVTKKIYVSTTYNKGSLFKYEASSGTSFQIFANDCVVWVSGWGRQGETRPFRGLGGAFGDKAAI